MNSLIAETLSQNQTAHLLHTTEVMAISVRFFSYFGQSLMAVAMSVRHLQSVMYSLNWPITKTPVISDQILVICYRNAFVTILVQKFMA